MSVLYFDRGWYETLKWHQIEIEMSREAFQNRWITDVALVSSKSNLTDTLIKPGKIQLHLEVMRTGKLKTAGRQ